MGDGHTYERKELDEWLKSNNTSPMTNMELDSKQYAPNFALKSQIDEYMRKNSKRQPQNEQEYVDEVFVPCNSKIIRSSAIVKIQMVGDPNTGKTSFVQYAEFGEFEPTMSTLGIDTKYLQLAKQYNEKTIVLEVRDVPGQFDAYKSMLRGLYRDIHGCILMCSIDNEDSVISLESNWIKEINEYAPDNVYCAVILNKYDLMNKCRDQKKLKKYQAIESMARLFAREHGFTFYTTSCKSGSYIHAALKDLAIRITKDKDMWLDIISKKDKGLRLSKDLGTKSNSKRESNSKCC